MRRLLRALLFVSLLPLLSACTNDGAAYLVDGVQQNNISIVRESLLWDKQVNLYVVVSRIPDCQRRHFVQKANPRAHIELWEFKPNEGTYILKIGRELYVTETRTCENFARMDEHDEALPDGKLGKQLGTFGLINGVFSFVPTEEPEEESAAGEGGEQGQGQ